jgi:hypothetical protein
MDIGFDEGCGLKLKGAGFSRRAGFSWRVRASVEVLPLVEVRASVEVLALVEGRPSVEGYGL